MEDQTVYARPLTLDDWENGGVHEGAVVYWKRDHGGDVTYDPATLVKVQSPVLTSEKPSRSDSKMPAGEGRWFVKQGTATVKSMYGVETGVTCRAEPSWYIFLPCTSDVEDAQQIEVTPYYGATAAIAVTVPGMQPEELERLLYDTLADRLPLGARLTKASSSPLAGRRVNIYRREPGGSNKILVASNVLEGEPGSAIGWPLGVSGVEATYIEPVPRSAIRE